MTKGKLLVLAAVIVLGSPAVAHAADYTDLSGDNGADADVGVVSVSSGADGYLHVKLNVANMPALLNSTTPVGSSPNGTVRRMPSKMSRRESCAISLVGMGSSS